MTTKARPTARWKPAPPVLPSRVLQLAGEHLKQEVVIASPCKAPLGFEIALVTSDVAALYDRAVKTGAAAVAEPATKPWGQTVAYVRDMNGFLVESCTPLP